MESKFINKETVEYIQSKLGSTTVQRLDGIEGNLKEVIQFLADYEKYNQSNYDEILNQFQSLTEKQNMMANRHLGSMMAMKQRVGKTLLVSLALSIVSIILAVVCLAK